MTYKARTKSVHGSGPPIFSLFCLCTFTEMHKKSSHHELLQADTTNTSNGLHGWSRLDLSPFLSNCRLEMQFSIYNYTREFQGETASLLPIQRGKAQAMSKFEFYFCSKILG
ncbi:PREDICTED: uncharacterized protein LOC107336442 isoform X1 [Acropora digitifera]|uniref:uncharacterized protein LOC107336442 isoform X1 n=1 Tax=Acropora digitifera TaxID=70779 RepID=UPI00077AEBCE|nr:PREDICTED: uncharacterized protein LOC107336442 isoform X1 [Acropora digitifera]